MRLATGDSELSIRVEYPCIGDFAKLAAGALIYTALGASVRASAPSVWASSHLQRVTRAIGNAAREAATNE